MVPWKQVHRGRKLREQMKAYRCRGCEAWAKESGLEGAWAPVPPRTGHPRVMSLSGREDVSPPNQKDCE